MTDKYTINRFLERGHKCGFEGCGKKAIAILTTEEGEAYLLCVDHLGPNPVRGRQMAMALCIPPEEW